MKKAPKSTRLAWPKGWRKSIWLIPAFGLFIKFIIISQIPGNAWLGADGENYLKGLDFLIRDGFLSQESILHYWPAGYPLLMWLLGALTPQLTLPIMAVFQSLLYAFATAFFSQKIHQTQMGRYAVATSLVLTISPTLSLNTMAIGYELISASIFLVALGLFIDLHNMTDRKLWDWRIFVIGALFSLNNFVQPRFLLSSLLFFLISGFLLYKKKFALVVISIGLILSITLPTVMIVRNVLANNFAAVSTNLGMAFKLGAGENATGGYVPSYEGLQCPKINGNAAQVDQALITCTIKWYLNNPSEMLRLGINKSIYFWSPWFGPIANGSMARNPWIKLNPFYDLATGSQEGYNLVFGLIGKTASWIWLFGYIGMMVFGAIRLMREGTIGKSLALLISTLIFSNWLVSLGTLGDHRQRVPILSMIVFLQIVGWMNMKKQSRSRRKSRR